MQERFIIVGYSSEVVAAAKDLGIDIFGYVDCDHEPNRDLNYLGNDEMFFSKLSQYTDCRIVITVDDCNTRFHLYNNYKERGVRFGKLMMGYVADSAKVGEGAILMPGTRVSDRSILAENCRLNFDALVGHDNVVSHSVIYAPRAVSLGHVNVGERSYLGANSTVCPRLKIGSNVLISAGSTIADNVRGGFQVMGYYPLPKMSITMPNARS